MNTDPTFMQYLLTEDGSGLRMMASRLIRTKLVQA
jgi:hypothetical protein